MAVAANSPSPLNENGAIMAANVLNSPEAVRMSVFVIRAFVKMRELLGGTKELARQLADLERKLTARLDGHEVAIVEVLRRVMEILDPPPLTPEPPRRRIGFHVEPEEKPESRAKVQREKKKAIHLIQKDHELRPMPVAPSSQTYESGFWKLSIKRAKLLVGGNIFLSQKTSISIVFWRCNQRLSRSTRR